MKRQFLGLMMALMACVMMFCSCSKDENGIEGPWKLNRDGSYYQYIVVKETKGVDAITGATYTDSEGNTIEERNMDDLKITECEVYFHDDGTCEGWFIQDGTIYRGTVSYTYEGQNLTWDDQEWRVITLDKDQLVMERLSYAAAEKGANKEFRHIAFSRM